MRVEIEVKLEFGEDEKSFGRVKKNWWGEIISVECNNLVGHG